MQVPEEHLVSLGHLLEPLPALRHHGGVRRAVDEIEELLRRLPDGEVHDQPKIYTLAPLRAELEARARDNLQRRIRELSDATRTSYPDVQCC